MSKQKLFAMILIVILGFACYFNSLFVPFIWDDIGLVANNYLIKDARYIGKIFTTDLFNLQSEGCNFYRPLQALSYILDYQIWGLNPLGYHLTNIILHILAAVLVYFLVSSIMSSRLRRDRQVSSKAFTDRPFTIPLFAALLFVIHPIHVEAVTYIAGRADMLVAVFLLSALIFFMRGRFLFSLASFACAILSKELALIFPFVLIVCAVYGFIPKKKAHPVYFSVLLLISIGYLYLRFAIFSQNKGLSFLAALNNDSLFFLKAPFLYLKTLFLPFNLHMSYTVTLPKSIYAPEILLSVIGLILFLVIIIKTRRNFRLVSFGLAWFFLFLSPHLGLIPLNAFFAEHFCYLASIGIFLILGAGFSGLVSKKKIFILLPALLVIFYVFLTIRYNFVWQNEERFYKRILEFSQNSFTVYNNLGYIEEKNGNYPQAEKYYLKALGFKPDFEYAFINLLRTIYLSGREEAAIRQLKDYLEWHPKSFWAWANLGSMHKNRKEYPQSIAAYKRSLAINPSIPSHRYFLGLTYLEAGDVDAAIGELTAGIASDSNNFAYHNELGMIYKNKGLFDAAIKEYLYALKLSPENTEIVLNLAVAYSLAGNMIEAERYFLKAINLDKNSVLAHYNLGTFYWRKRDFSRAKEELDKALAINPDFNGAKIWRDKLAGVIPD